MSEGFGPGFNGALLLASDATSPAQVASAARLRTAIIADPGVASVGPIVSSGKGVLIEVVSKGSPQDESTTQLVHRLRDHVIPDNTTGTGLDFHVGSQTAIGVDLADTLGQRLPFMFLTILLLSFVLLMLVFRSLLVPLKAVIMNLLSIGAAYGVIVAIFQWGWVKSVDRHRQGRPDRGVGPDDAVRDRVRALDGLRGVPPQPDQGGVRPDRRQRRPRSRTDSRRRRA